MWCDRSWTAIDQVNVLLNSFVSHKSVVEARIRLINENLFVCQSVSQSDSSIESFSWAQKLSEEMMVVIWRCVCVIIRSFKGDQPLSWGDTTSIIGLSCVHQLVAISANHRRTEISEINYRDKSIVNVIRWYRFWSVHRPQWGPLCDVSIECIRSFLSFAMAIYIYIFILCAAFATN